MVLLFPERIEPPVHHQHWSVIAVWWCRCFFLAVLLEMLLLLLLVLPSVVLLTPAWRCHLQT